MSERAGLLRWCMVVACAALAAALLPRAAGAWNDEEFEHRPLYAYPLPHGRDNIVGNLVSYQIQKGDTLLDVGRWFGLSAKEISDANKGLDWWAPTPGRQVILPDEHVLPDAPHQGIILNIPEMRLYYYYPSPIYPPGTRWKTNPVSFTPAYEERKGATKKDGVGKKDGGVKKGGGGGMVASVVYTFPVGLGRFDWKTPVGAFTVKGKTRNPTWVVPDDIYKEHLERDGEAEHVVKGGDEDNPLGLYRLELTLPEYALHGTNVPWGVGMEVSHGCIRLYPEDIERLFNKVKVGTPGEFVYQPIKFGWRGDSLYVEVHEDLYGVFPGLWQHAIAEVKRRGLFESVDFQKLQKAIEAKTGVPTYIMPGAPPEGTSASNGAVRAGSVSAAAAQAVF